MNENKTLGGMTPEKWAQQAADAAEVVDKIIGVATDLRSALPGVLEDASLLSAEIRKSLPRLMPWEAGTLAVHLLAAGWTRVVKPAPAPLLKPKGPCRHCGGSWGTNEIESDQCQTKSFLEADHPGKREWAATHYESIE